MAEIYWQTLLITLINLTIAIVGITFNLAIVWITVRNKNLQNSHGLFLAIYSLCEAALESGTFLPTTLVLLRTKISLPICFYASLQVLWSTTNASFNLLFISVDRLLAMLFPIFYHFVLKNKAGKYVIAMNCLSSAYIFVFVYSDYLYYVLANSKNTVYCASGDQFGGQMLTWGLDNVIVLNVVTLSIYIILGIVIKVKKDGSSQAGNVHQQTRRIYKSLMAIVGVIFLLYFMGFFGAQFIIPLLTSDPALTFLYFRLFAQLISLAGAINAPMLYFLSTEYRNVLNQHFPFIRTFLHFWHIHRNANNNVVQLEAATSTSPPRRTNMDMANQSTQRQMPSQ